MDPLSCFANPDTGVFLIANPDPYPAAFSMRIRNRIKLKKLTKILLQLNKQKTKKIAQMLKTMELVQFTLNFFKSYYRYTVLQISSHFSVIFKIFRHL